MRRQHRAVFQDVRSRTGRFLPEETYSAVCAFVTGYDCACEGGALLGFQEWLVVRLGMGENLAWSALVLYAVFPDTPDPRARLRSDATFERVAIETLFDLLAEFDEAIERHGGLGMVFAAHQRWKARHLP